MPDAPDTVIVNPPQAAVTAPATVVVNQPLPAPPPLGGGASTPGGDRSSPMDSQGRDLTISGSASGWALPLIYGTHQVTGQLNMAATVENAGSLILGYILADPGEPLAGENTESSPYLTFANVQWNGDAITSADWLTAYETAKGTVDQVRPAFVESAHTGGYVYWPSDRPGTAAWYAKVSLELAPGGLPTITAEATRADIADWGGTPRHSHNVAVALWDYMRRVKGVTSSEIDATSWAAARDWCDTRGWTFNAALQSNDTEEAIQQICLHGFLFLPQWRDGKWYLAYQGALTSSVLDIVDADLTGPVKKTYTPWNQRYNHVTVYWTDPTTWQRGTPIVSEESGLTLARRRAVEITLQGCTSSTMAADWCAQYRMLSTLEHERWTVPVRTRGIVVRPGDKVTLQSYKYQGLASAKTLRVLDVVSLPDETFVLHCSNYSSLAQGGMAVPHITPTRPHRTNILDVPTACDEELIWSGAWATQSQCGDPNDLTDGWTAGAGYTLVYNAGSDYSTLVATSATPTDGITVAITPGSAAALLVSACLSLLVQGNTTDYDHVQLKYQTSPDGSTWTDQTVRQLWPSAAVGKFLPYCEAIKVESATYHRLLVTTPALTGGATATQIALKGVYAVPWETDPGRISAGASNLRFTYRHTWTEDANAADTIAAYQLVRKTPGPPSTWPIMASAAVGSTSLSASLIPDRVPHIWGGGGGVGAVNSWAPVMVARGLTGRAAAFPAPTAQTFDEPFLPSPPTSVVQQFVFHGAWEAANEVGDPDDLSGWSDSDMGAVYTAGTDLTTLTPGSDFCYIYAAPTFPTLATYPSRALLLIAYRLHDHYQAGQHFTIYARVHVHDPGGDYDMDLTEVSLPVADASDTDWHIRAFIYHPPTGTAGWEVYIKSEDGIAPYMELDVKRVLLIPFSGNSPINLDVFESISWTEAADAGDTVASYQAYRETAHGEVVDAEVPQGETQMLVPMLGRFGSILTDHLFRAAGPWGSTEFVPGTQSFVGEDAYGRVDHLYDIDTTGEAEGLVLMVGSDGLTKEYAPITHVATYGISGLLTVEAGSRRWYPPAACTLVSVMAAVGTAPDGDDIELDVNINGASALSGPLVIANGDNESTVDTPSTTAMAVTDYLTVDVDQIGPTEPGRDLTLRVVYTIP